MALRLNARILRDIADVLDWLPGDVTIATDGVGSATFDVYGAGSDARAVALTWLADPTARPPAVSDVKLEVRGVLPSGGPAAVVTVRGFAELVIPW